MAKVTIEFIGHEQANAFFLWFTENGGLEAFEQSKWAKIANMFNVEIKDCDADARTIIVE